MNIDINKSSNYDDSSKEELEHLLASKEKKIKELQENLKETQGRLHDVIVDKKDLEKRINNLELKELNLKLCNFDELKVEYRKLEHRIQITKKQLDDARIQIKSQQEYVDNARDQVEFMEKVIKDMENRGLTDYLRKRFPDNYIEYKNR